MAKNDDKSAKAKTKSKDKDKAKGKKGKKGKGNGEPIAGSSIATHARARNSIRLVKGWAGIGGFAVAALLSLQASVPLFQVGLRALGAGLVGYLLAWWFSVIIWRQIIMAEHRAAFEELERRRAEADEQQPQQGEAQPVAG